MMPSDDLVKYFIAHTDAKFDALEKKVDKLITFRWMLVGAASGVSFVVSIGWKVIELYAGNK